MSKESKYSIPTQLIYGEAGSTDWDYSDHVIPPLTRTSTYRLRSAERGASGFDAIGKEGDKNSEDKRIYIYGRMADPNKVMLADAIARAEEGEVAVMFATGMAAVHAAVTFPLTQKANKIISHSTIYGCSYSLFTTWFKKMGIHVDFCDLKKPDSFLDLVDEHTRVLYLESPANPTLDLLDLPEITKLVAEINKSRSEENKILTVMDNTFATPYCQRPITMGVDVVLHSLTKGLSGFGTELGGAVVTRKEFNGDLVLHRKDFGGDMSPSTAWHIHAYGIPTLSLRVPKQIANAQKIAQFLEDHPEVEQVFYPGLESFPQYELAQKVLKDYDGNFAPGFMIYFTIKAASPEASKERGKKIMNYIADNAYCITLAVSLGQLRTLIEHPGSMTHLAYSAEEQIKAGIHPGGIRLAVGIESVDDVIKDLDTAIKTS